MTRTTSRPARYALLGTGGRAQLYLDALTGPYASVAELVAWGDTNAGGSTGTSAGWPRRGTRRRSASTWARSPPTSPVRASTG